MVVALLDPDMVFVRPITTQIRGNDNNLYAKSVLQSEIPDKIGKGFPVAQTYGLGAPWANDNHKKFNRGKICGEGSPCLIPDERYGSQHYSVGPPYIVHKGDLHRLAETWTKFVPRYGSATLHFSQTIKSFLLVSECTRGIRTCWRRCTRTPWRPRTRTCRTCSCGTIW